MVATVSTTPRILAVTPRYRRIGRAIIATTRMLDAAGVPVDHLDMVGDQPFGRDGPGAVGNQNIVYLYTRAREIFLRGDWTHLLTLEDDILPPPDALPRLLEADAAVCYSLYCWRRQGHPWSPYRVLFEDSGESYIHEFPREARAAAQAGSVLEVRGVGLGCTLIRRDVAEAVPFRIPKGSRFANDWHFAWDCQRAGFRQFAHFGVQCGHIRLDPSARIIWPDAEAPEGYRYEYMEIPAPQEVPA